MGAAPVLTILRNGETIKSLPIEGEALLGRSEGCVIRLEDRAISRQHALFRRVGDRVQVEGKSEFSPLVINGAECTKAVLKEGDVIALGPYLLRLSGAAAGGAVAAESLPSEMPSLDTVLPEPILTNEPQGGQFEAQPAVFTEAPSQALDAISPEVSLSTQEATPDASIDASPVFNITDQQPEVSHSEVPSGAIEMPVFTDTVDQDAQTKITPVGKVAVRLKFTQGAANVEDYELTKDEIVIGRGKNCDIILNDKKASRRNTVIRRSGLNFVIKDLGSSNGTYVNGVRITEHELGGDDKIKIGGVEFQFSADNLEYATNKKDFISLEPFDPAQSGDASGKVDELAVPDFGFPASPSASPAPSAPVAVPSSTLSSGAIPTAGILGIPGMGGVVGAKKRATLIGRFLVWFRAQPKPKQYLVILLIVGGLWVFLDDEESADLARPKPKKQTSGAVLKDQMTFEKLSPEQRRQVEEWFQRGFDKFKAKDYDSALFELDKIFKLIPDYKTAREIEKYAREGQRMNEALKEEQKRREDEARIKAEVAQLVDETKERMAKREYEQARELFTRIISLDPDNLEVANWRKILDDYEEQKRLQAQERGVQEEINKRGWDIYREGLVLKKQGKYNSAIKSFQGVADVGSSDQKLLKLAKSMISACRSIIKARRDPVLTEAKQMEDSGEFAKAYQLYEKATKIDPDHHEGYAGMNRIRGTLHERAKAIYTEAVLAESYSDFTTARNKFKECLETAPKDDVYHERAARKLSRYFKSGTTGSEP